MARKYQAPRGTQDILPEEQPVWDFVRDTAARLSALFGYGRIETPLFEEASLFTRGVGEVTDIVQKEMYVFKDRGGLELALRPEGTAPVCRAYLEHGMHNQPQPVRLWYWTPIFRYDRPQAGRYRQHHQFGIEAIGEADAAVDAEVIELLWRFYEALGLSGLTLHLNSIGDYKCRPQYLEILRDYYRDKLDLVCEDCRVRFERNPLRLLDCKQERCQPIIAGAPPITDHLCEDCAAHFGDLRSYLDTAGIPVSLNPRLVRGLDYYTRTVFEITPPEEGAQSTIGGGGRYDGLIELLGGRPTPGIGFGTGIERIILNLKRQGVPLPQRRDAAGLRRRPDTGRARGRLPARLGAATGGRRDAARGRRALAQGADARGGRPRRRLRGDHRRARVEDATVTVRRLATGEQEAVSLANLAGWLAKA